MSEATPKSYRPDIDGLRAIAVLGVLFYHLDEGWLGGGFVGVDVFFVISGFLISGIIEREISGGTFSITGFYERRIRRIFPALFGMLVAVIAASWFLLLPDDFLALAKSLRYAVIGISNVLFFRNTQDYFNETAAPVPLLHTWSLGVEEQFYLVFPLLLWLAHRSVKSARARLCFVVVLAAVSFAASVWMVGRQPMSAFFLLPYRAWELLLGTVVALGAWRPLGRGLNHAMGIAGLCMIAGSMWWFDGGTPFPGAAALLPCAGTALLLWSGRDESSWACRLLSAKPMVFMGLISYSVYLWHWPLIVLTKYRGEMTLLGSAFVLTGSLLAGYLSWRFIERPFRKPAAGSRKRLFLTFALLAGLAVSAETAIRKAEGYPARFSSEVQRLLAFKEKPAHWKDGTRGEPDVLQVPVYGTAGVPPRFALWSDSHGASLVPVLDLLAKEQGVSFAKYGQGALPPVVGVVEASDTEPEAHLKYNQQVLDRLVTDRSIHTVMLHARWSLYHKGQNENREAAVKSFHGVSFGTPEQAEQFYFGKIRETVAGLIAAGKRVILIGPVPEVGIDVPDMLAKQCLAGRPLPAAVECSDFHERNSTVIRLLGSLPGTEVLMPHEILLNDGHATVMAGGDVLYLDDDHLSSAGAMHLRPLLEGMLRSTR